MCVSLLAKSWLNVTQLFNPLLTAYVVTEVVWEDTETNTKKKEEDTDTSKKLNDSKSANAGVNRYVSIYDIANV